MPKIMLFSKQINYLIHIWERSDRQAHQFMWKKIPRNNARYPDMRADYRRQIIADFLMQRSTPGQVSYLIQLIENGAPSYMFKKVINSLNKNNGKLKH